METIALHGSMRIVFLVGVFALPGCVVEDSLSASAIRESYQDAPERFYNEVSGAEEVEHNVPIPAGTTNLTVKAKYRTGGAAEFRLTAPDGATGRSDEVAGSKSTEDSSWYADAAPKAGTWQLYIGVAGGATYVFAFYYEAGDGSVVEKEVYVDATHRYTNTVAGSESKAYSFEVPPRADRLTVKANFHISGSGSMELVDTLGRIRAQEHVAGTKSVDDDQWYSESMPLLGEWSLRINIAGSGAYAFGVYVDA